VPLAISTFPDARANIDAKPYGGLFGSIVVALLAVEPFRRNQTGSGHLEPRGQCAQLALAYPSCLHCWRPLKYGAVELKPWHLRHPSLRCTSLHFSHGRQSAVLQHSGRNWRLSRPRPNASTLPYAGGRSLGAPENADANNNGLIELNELASYVQSLVPKISPVVAEPGESPEAQFPRFGSRGENFVIAGRLP